MSTLDSLHKILQCLEFSVRNTVLAICGLLSNINTDVKLFFYIYDAVTSKYLLDISSRRI